MEATWGTLCLTPRQYQEFRLLLRLSRNCMVTIPGYGAPFVEELLPLCAKSDVVLKTLLAWAASTRFEKSPGSIFLDSHPYQTALEDVQRDVSGLTDLDLADSTRLQASISTAILLSFLSSTVPGDLWYLHVSRIASFIDHLDLSGLKVSRSGLFTLMLIAFFDIEAFSVGKPNLSLKAWLKWDLSQSQVTETLTSDGIPNPFLPFELVTGYSISLVSLIAIISSYAHSSLQASSVSPPSGSVDEYSMLEVDEATRLRLLIESWEPPTFPPSVPAPQRQALSSAWRTIQKAALIYHLRGQGFKSNLLLPLACPAGKSAYTLIEEVLIGIRYLRSLWKSEKITTLNCMAWPLAVIGCECGEPIYEGLADEIMYTIDILVSSFRMCQLASLKDLLKTIWNSKLQFQAGLQTEAISLEVVANLQGNIVPLF